MFCFEWGKGSVQVREKKMVPLQGLNIRRRGEVNRGDEARSELLLSTGRI